MARCKLTLVDVGDGKGAVWHVQSHPPLPTPEQEEVLTALEVRNNKTLAQNMICWGIEGIYSWIKHCKSPPFNLDYHTKQDSYVQRYNPPDTLEKRYSTTYFPGERIKDVRSVATLIIIDGADGKVHYRYKCVPKHFPTDTEEVWAMPPEELFKRLTPALNMLLAAINNMNTQCAILGLSRNISPEESYSV